MPLTVPAMSPTAKTNRKSKDCPSIKGQGSVNRALAWSVHFNEQISAEMFGGNKLFSRGAAQAEQCSHGSEAKTSRDKYDRCAHGIEQEPKY